MFKQYLEYAKKYPNTEENQKSHINRTKQIQNHQILYTDIDNADMDDLVASKKIFGEDVCFMGYPSFEKKGIALSTGMNSMKIGISKNSKVHQGAWKFVKKFLTNEYAVCHYIEYIQSDFPIRKDAFESIIKTKTSKEEYIDIYGHTIEPLSGDKEFDDFTVTLEPYSEEEVTFIKMLMESIDHGSSNDNQISMIISEETVPFFNDKRSVEETQKNIQNRVSIYLSEMK